MAEVEAEDDTRRRVPVAVAGWKDQHGDVQQLATLARATSDEESFRTQLRTDGRWAGRIRGRYQHLRDLVVDGRRRPPTPPRDS